MKAAILLENGFEDTEALATRDILLRSREIEVTLLSCCGEIEVTSSNGLRIFANRKIEEIQNDEFDFLILPGGKKGVENLKKNQKALDLIRDYKNKGKEVHAICAAPSILGELGYLEGCSYTCYPGFQTAENYTGLGVNNDKGLITGKGMAYSLEFGLEIVRHYLGEGVANRVKNGARGE